MTLKVKKHSLKVRTSESLGAKTPTMSEGNNSFSRINLL